jgi:hypothetical protein
MTKEFSSNDATLAAFGQEVTGFKKVSYGHKLEVVKNYSGNNKPNSYSIGKEESEFKIELYMSQMRIWEQIRKSQTGNSKLLGMNVTMAITYLNDDLGETTDVARFVIKSQGKEVGGGAEGLAYELETECLGIDIDV